MKAFLVLALAPALGLSPGISLAAAETAASAPAPRPARASQPTDGSSQGALAPDWEALSHAVARGQHDGVARAASRIGLPALARRLTSPESSPAELKEALRAVATLDEAPVLAIAVAVHLRHGDVDVARAALDALTATLHPGEESLHARIETPRRALDDICRLLAGVAVDDARPIDLRLSTLQAIDAAPRCSNEAALRLLTAPSPEIRRAAVLVADADDLAESLFARLEDGSAEVAAVAAAKLCQAHGPTARESRRLPAAIVTAARRFALAHSTDAADVVELLDCLALSSDPADRNRLERAASHGRPAIRAHARRLLARP